MHTILSKWLHSLVHLWYNCFTWPKPALPLNASICVHPCIPHPPLYLKCVVLFLDTTVLNDCQSEINGLCNTSLLLSGWFQWHILVMRTNDTDYSSHIKAVETLKPVIWDPYHATSRNYLWIALGSGHTHTHTHTHTYTHKPTRQF